MDKERSVDRLARYVIYAVAAAVAAGLCWCFRSVLSYIIMASVVSLLGKPVMQFLGNVIVRRKHLPEWLRAAITLMAIFVVFAFVLVWIIPIVVSIFQTISGNMSSAGYTLPVESFKVFMSSINEWLIAHFPQFGPDFKIEKAIGTFLGEAIDANSVSSVIEHIASFFVSFGIGVFSVAFISFFFIRDPKLFGRIVGSLVPDRIEDRVIDAIGDIEYLLSRYFAGLLVEVLGVALLNFSGLWLIAGIGFNAAVGISFITGILNIIPYVGPWVGAIIGTLVGAVLKFSVAGLSVNFWSFIVLLIVIFVVTQLIDNILFQPLIYSTSIKSSPLEIFIVLLIAGNLGGMTGMLVAIPSYTVARVIAGRFFTDIKAIRRLIPEDSVSRGK